MVRGSTKDINSAVVPWVSPYLRWAGSKRKLIPTLLVESPANFTRYVEPFAGSACLFFAMNPNQAILGDMNCELILTYQTLRKHPRIISRLVESFPQ